MPRPSSDDMLAAAEWLSLYDSESAECEQMFRVAEWLREEVARANERGLARQHGVSVSRLRTAMRKLAAAGE